MKLALAPFTRLALCALCAFDAAPAAADPCERAIGDPVATPVLDAAIDAQRGACARSELSAQVTTHALIDTPGFHGVLGGELALGGRLVLDDALEVGARLRLVDVTFVQTAVNKVTDTRLGPAIVSAAYGGALGPGARLAAVASAELPYTRDETDTVHAGGQLAAVVSARLAPRWLLHARLGVVGALASSSGGTARQLGLRAGADAAWRLARCFTLLGGVESQAGWYGGFDALVLRAGLHARAGRAYRIAVGVGAPLGGADPTNAVLQVGIARDL